jgi:cyclophilin family peptidyl-prolyl cis-trans isomerase
MKLKLLTVVIIVAAFCACNSAKKTEQRNTTIKTETKSAEDSEENVIANNEETKTMEQETKNAAPQQAAEQEIKKPATVKTSAEPVFDIVTSMGTIRIKLYNETPKHRDNFIKLATEGFYDGVLFHRVINNFMIQTGDPDSKNASPDVRLGMGGPGYQIDAEILPQFKHKKGSVAAARMGDQVNPERKSSGSQFYIVQNPQGTPHLDGQYTVFGETIQGLDVVDKIANTAKGQADRPVQDIKIEKIVRIQ